MRLWARVILFRIRVWAVMKTAHGPSGSTKIGELLKKMSNCQLHGVVRRGYQNNFRPWTAGKASARAVSAKPCLEYIAKSSVSEIKPEIIESKHYATGMRRWPPMSNCRPFTAMYALI